jgi:hypothetical protein
VEGDVRWRLARTGSVASMFVLFAVVSAAGPPRSKHADPKSAPEPDSEIPASASDRKNPIAASDENLGAGRMLWRTHCETSHGTFGKGDGPNARLHEARKGYAPRNLTDPDVQENLTDGDIFWRISKGIIEGDNVIKPTYENKVPSETARWQLVLFVRHLRRQR